MVAISQSPWKWRVFLLSTLCAPLLLSSCVQMAPGDLTNSASRTMNVVSKVATFSFEYPAFYQRIDGPSVEDSAQHRFVGVDVLAAEKKRPLANLLPGNTGETVEMSYTPASIKVLVSDTAKSPGQNAATRISSTLALKDAWPNFKVLSQSTRTVAGVEAQLISYQVDSVFGTWPLEYHTQVVFDRGVMIWDFEAIARDADIAETVRADLDHVLETLKIVD